ncbi:MAG TPA: hypothetical protein VMZ91_14935, partial [Candidatus Paceibacterota bacterium]|nr:hypothetical protein [Candidatus Paceibacterota bacterium]
EEYKNVNAPMRYRCFCGNVSKICFSSFKRGSRCNKCGTKKGTEKQKHSLEYIKQYFEDQCCLLLENEYINCMTLMTYKCSCGNISEISFDNFKQGKRCRKCSGCEKYKFKKVKQYFEDNNYQLLEDKYINNSILMKYKCPYGHTGEITFSSFKQGHRCSQCNGNKKYKLKEVKQHFEDNNCELLENNYINSQTKMRYKCSCGNISKIKFNKFKQGQRCQGCSGIGYSKESQKLFDAIYEKINIKYKKKTYYATLNKEFTIRYNNKGFKYDYVNSKFKKAIEYNGSKFHPIPILKDSAKNWFVYNKTKTAKEARDYEKIKYEGLEKRGYKILTAWDYEMKKDFDALVQKCLDFLVA